MTQKFVYIRKNGEPSLAESISATMVVARMRAVAGEGPFQLDKDGDVGPERKRLEALNRLDKALVASAVGDRFHLISGNGDVVFKCHAVQPLLVVVDISGNHLADVYYSTILQQFPQYAPRYAGSYVCKDVAGTSTPSQHSYGNAVDFFFASLVDQDIVAEWVVAQADELHIEHAISRDRIWTLGQGWHAYTGDYHSHLHVDFDPQYGGPCGVRG